MTALWALVASAAGLSVANSLHCAGMCGAFALTARGRPEWHAGRLVTYGVLGLVAGTLGGAAAGAASPLLRVLAALLASAVLAWFSLQLGGWVRASAPGRAFAPLARLLRRVASEEGGIAARFALGAAGSLVPCGVVYGGLALAALAGSALGGAVVMLGFGVGTAPALVLVSGGSGVLRRLGRHESLRRAAAVLALVLGLTSIWWRAPVDQLVHGGTAPATCHQSADMRSP